MESAKYGNQHLHRSIAEFPAVSLMPDRSVSSQSPAEKSFVHLLDAEIQTIPPHPWKV